MIRQWFELTPGHCASNTGQVCFFSAVMFCWEECERERERGAAGAERGEAQCLEDLLSLCVLRAFSHSVFLMEISLCVLCILV